LLPLTVATPLVNVIAVGVPNAVATPELFVTVGDVTGFVDEFAPENVRDFPPVYPTTTLFEASLAVIVRFCGVPAVCVALPVITSLVAAPALMVTEPEFPDLPVPDVAVNVPAPVVPV
jgi:hypothetical protein